MVIYLITDHEGPTFSRQIIIPTMMMMIIINFIPFITVLDYKPSTSKKQNKTQKKDGRQILTK